MMEKPSDVINEFIWEVKSQLGSHIQQIVLFGSYARNYESEGSDIDILLLVDYSDAEIKEIQYSIYDVAFELEMATGKDISPVIINIEQFRYWKDTLPFYRNIKREGVVLHDTKGV